MHFDPKGLARASGSGGSEAPRFKRSLSMAELAAAELVRQEEKEHEEAGLEGLPQLPATLPHGLAGLELADEPPLPPLPQRRPPSQQLP